MADDLLSLMAGIAQGFAQGKQVQADNEMRDLQMQIMKDQKKLQEDEAEYKRRILEAIFGGSGSPGIVEADVGEGMQSFDGSGENTQAESPISGLSPMEMMALGEVSDMNILGAGRLEHSIKSDRERLDIQKEGLKFRGQSARAAEKTAEARDIVTDTVDGAQFGYPGAQVKVRIRKSTGEVIGLVGKGKPIFKSPPAGAEVQGPAESALWFHTEDLSTPESGQTPDQLEAQGYKKLTAGRAGGIPATASALKLIGDIEGLVEKVFPLEEKGLMERLKGGTERTLGAWAQTNPDAAVLLRKIKGSLAPIIRSMGEKGALSDGDVKRATAALPKLTDSPAVARRLLAEVRGVLETAKEVTLGMGVRRKEPSVQEQFNRLTAMGVSDEDAFARLKDAGVIE